ncbi:MAG: ROK family protein [Sedimentisphaerales bacterium]|nr:ROK family protein [Sedimentisphaerales bacterium]
MADNFIGIDLGGTNIKIGIITADFKLLWKTSIPTDAQMGPGVVIDRIAEAVKDKTDTIKAIGIGSPGPAKYSEGVLIRCTNMPKFTNVPISNMLKEKFDKPVILENDANAACFGEFVAGAGKDIKNMVFFTLGTGIGGGIISDGKLLHGSGDNAAELGHIIVKINGRLCNCGQKGCAEAYASASATAKRTMEAIEAGEKSSLKEVLEQNGQITCKDVYEHLAGGDELAKKITDETAEILAVLCINTLHCTEPEKIVFAGGMIAAGDVLLERIRFYFKQHVWKIKPEDSVEICFATLGEDAGIIGAAALAVNL